MKTTEKTTVIIDPKEYGLEESKATQIEQSFTPKIVEREALVSVYENILTKEISKSVSLEASDLRKKLVKVRTGIAEIHKVEKAFYLASGRYVDALKNKYTLPIEQMEDKLLEIEKYYENLEKERIFKLQKEREGLLLAFEVENVESLNLGTMSDEIFDGFLVGTKQKYEAKKETERKAEEERIAQAKAEEERIEAQRIENERLKAEAEIREKELKAERERSDKIKAEAERVAKEEADRLAKKLAEEKAKNDAILAEQKRLADIEAKKQADINAKLEAELKAKKDAEIEAENKRKAEELKAQKEAEKLAKAPIKKQLSTWVDGFTIDLPGSELINNEKALLIKDKFDAFKKWAKEQVETI